ncbi:hypothetical protein QUF79_00895 [Fictibacillus enclensis]|nr:hypothetical protein [Fictibacillus enclensis]
MKINRVLFTENCLSNINKIINEHIIETEIGGCLVGYQVGDSLIVTHASGAGEKSKMDYDYIEIDGEYTTRYSNRLNELSNHRLYFLGDWHTHLSNNLSPSMRELKAIKGLSKFIPIEYRDTLITTIINHFNTKYFKVYCLDNNEEIKEVTCSVIQNLTWIEDFI